MSRKGRTNPSRLCRPENQHADSKRTAGMSAVGVRGWRVADWVSAHRPQAHWIRVHQILRRQLPQPFRRLVLEKRNALDVVHRVIDAVVQLVPHPLCADRRENDRQQIVDLTRALHDNHDQAHGRSLDPAEQSHLAQAHAHAHANAASFPHVSQRPDQTRPDQTRPDQTRRHLA